ncbi:hypothetical protein WG906_13805 [Pedobacter sp. P351]|uniref:hypothetical protein n=1 Tax=Pedobacter superstes TaxID=3133441 RepID=UPI003095AB4D
MLDSANTNGAVHSKYYIDANKILHWDMVTKSPSAYIPDIYTSQGWENMVQFNVYGVDGGINEFYLNEETFPFSSQGHYSGTIDLSALSWSEIQQTDCQTQFYYISGVTSVNPDYTSYIDLNYLQ